MRPRFPSYCQDANFDYWTISNMTVGPMKKMQINQFWFGLGHFWHPILRKPEKQSYVLLIYVVFWFDTLVAVVVGVAVVVSVLLQALQVSELTNITGSKDWGKAVDKYMRRSLHQPGSRFVLF